MNRREMVEESLRSIGRALPAMLTVLGGLGVLLKPKEEVVRHRRALCFPGGHKKSEVILTKKTNNKEGRE